VISGVAILLAHPRLYWGETGARSGPSLIDLPLPFVLDVPIRGPGRYLHFLAAWIALFTGLIYVISGLFTRHFRRHLLPEKSDLSWKQIREVILRHLRFERPPKEEALTYKPPPATHVSVGNLRSISSDVLDRSRHVSSGHIRIPDDRHYFWRPAISTHDSFLRCLLSSSVFFDPYSDGLPRWVCRPHSRDDHRSDSNC